MIYENTLHQWFEPYAQMGAETLLVNKKEAIGALKPGGFPAFVLDFHK